MTKEEKSLTCSKCKKENVKDAKFCSYCGEKILTDTSWADSLANQLIKIANDTEGESHMLKTLGFDDKVTERMKIDGLIWRMFATNLVIQEKTEERGLNDILHRAVAEKIYKSEKEIEKFFNLIKTRYDVYHSTLNSKSDQMMFNLAMDYLDFFIFGKADNNEYPNKGKLIPITMTIAEDFSSFIQYLRENWFKN